MRIECYVVRSCFYSLIYSIIPTLDYSNFPLQPANNTVEPYIMPGALLPNCNHVVSQYSGAESKGRANKLPTFPQFRNSTFGQQCY